MMHAHDPLQPHSHEPNPTPPSPDPTLQLTLPDGREIRISPADLATLPQTAVPGCFIISTGHGTSGPFTFGGVALADFLAGYDAGSWSAAEIISGDGFGNRVLAEEVVGKRTERPILLATHVDGRPLNREEGLVRLIVPGEVDDALRQVKWIARIVLRQDAGNGRFDGDQPLRPRP